MQATLVFIILMVGLFVVSYFTRRRFGVLGLALCAGLLLSNSWSATLTPLLERHGVSSVVPPLDSLVAGALILLPSFLLLFSGPTYNKSLGRLIGAIAFALFAFVLLLGPLSMWLTFDGFSLQLYKVLTNSRNSIIIGGIVLALIDTLGTRTPKKHHRSREEH